MDWSDFDKWMIEQGFRDSTRKVGLAGAQRFVRLAEAGRLDEYCNTVGCHNFAHRLARYAKARGLELATHIAGGLEALRNRAQARPTGLAARRGRKRVRLAHSIADADWQRLWAVVVDDPSPPARVLEVMMVSAMRCGDVLRMERVDFLRDYETGILKIEQKGGEDRLIPVVGAPATWARLRDEWTASREGANLARWVCPDGDGSPRAGECAYRRVDRKLKRLGAKAGIAGRLNTHRLRRTVAVQALRLTQDVVAVQEMLGHVPGSRATYTYIDESRPDAVADLQQKLASRFRPEAEAPEPQGQSAITFRPHPRILPNAGEYTVYVTDVDDDTVRISSHPGREFGPTMPRESLQHFVDDLMGRVNVPPSTEPEIEAVRTGRAELLGKGDDGIAFRVGNRVVKVSTTVPFQPENPGHRSPVEAARMLRDQTELGNRLSREAGIQILPAAFIQHGDKGFQIKPYVEIPERWTREQLDEIQEQLHRLHDAGYSMNDQIQAGLLDDLIVFYDAGKVAPTRGTGIHSSARSDIDRLAWLYRDNNEKFVDTRAEPEPDWD